MTFEERIEKLTERDKAVAQTLELMGHRLDTIITAINQDAENIRALVRIAEIHESRIERLEAAKDRPGARG